VIRPSGLGNSAPALKNPFMLIYGFPSPQHDAALPTIEKTAISCALTQPCSLSNLTTSLGLTIIQDSQNQTPRRLITPAHQSSLPPENLEIQEYKRWDEMKNDGKNKED